MVLLQDMLNKNDGSWKWRFVKKNIKCGSPDNPKKQENEENNNEENQENEENNREELKDFDFIKQPDGVY